MLRVCHLETGIFGWEGRVKRGSIYYTNLSLRSCCSGATIHLLPGWGPFDLDGRRKRGILGSNGNKVRKENVNEHLAFNI